MSASSFFNSQVLKKQGNLPTEQGLELFPIPEKNKGTTILIEGFLLKERIKNTKYNFCKTNHSNER